jgi:hypothetical protein
MKNNIKKPLNSFNDIDKKILPFFSNPILLKKIEDKKKNKDLNQINPQKKLIYNIIKLNEKLVKFTTSIKNYNLNIDSFYLTETGNKLAETEFILFIRNNLYYNLKYRLSNILYKLERFIPVLKFNSLLYNINLFVPKRLFKPQPYIRFTYRIIQINNHFNNMNTQTDNSSNDSLVKSLKKDSSVETYSNNLISNYKSILPKGYAAINALESRKKVVIKINNYNLKSNFDYSITQLHKFENGRSINYILLNLNNLLNEINNIISIKDKLIKIIRIKNFSILDRNLFENVDQKIKMKENSISSHVHSFIRQDNLKEEGFFNGKAEFVNDQTSNQSVKNLRLKIKKINSNNYNNIDSSPLTVEEIMLKENIIKIEKSKGKTGDLVFNVEKDIIKENSNPVDLLYFNNNLKKPVINQYLKSMSTYNMISNGAILYYSNIIGFNFKKRIRAYLPFIKSVPVISLLGKSLQSTTNTIIKSSLSNEELNNNKFIIRNSERLTSPYSFRDLRKVVGSLDKGKFSVFGRGIENNKLINNIYKFLYLSFKSMYCLISKPVFIIKSNKIIVQLFYFLLIPKIFKHIKSKTNYNFRNKKKIYREFIDRRKKLGLAKLFETRLKEREDALKVKYFLTLPSQLIELKDGEKEETNFINTKVNNINSLKIGDNSKIQLNFDSESAKSLIKSYYEELLEIRKTEEKNSGVKFDKFGRVIMKSLDNKLTLNSLLFKFNKNKKSIKNKYNKIIKNLNKKKGGLPYKLFFKKFYSVGMNNHLHIVRIPRKFAPIFKKVNSTKFATSALTSNSNINSRLNYSGALPKVDKNKFTRATGGLQQNKLFKYVALTYLNIFNNKVTNPMLNRIKFKLK